MLHVRTYSAVDIVLSVMCDYIDRAAECTKTAKTFGAHVIYSPLMCKLAPSSSDGDGQAGKSWNLLQIFMSLKEWSRICIIFVHIRSRASEPLGITTSSGSCQKSQIFLCSCSTLL